MREGSGPHAGNAGQEFLRVDMTRGGEDISVPAAFVDPATFEDDGFLPERGDEADNLGNEHQFTVFDSCLSSSTTPIVKPAMLNPLIMLTFFSHCILAKNISVPFSRKDDGGRFCIWTGNALRRHGRIQEFLFQLLAIWPEAG
jgi:hypothetical protein